MIMKDLSFMRRVVAMITIFTLVLTGCSKDESVDTEVEQKDTTEVVLSSEIDKASEALDDIMIQVYENQEALETGRQSDSSVSSFMPDCVTITVVIEQQFRQVTIDFGTEGCLVNGHLLKGSIIMTYERNPEEQQVLITYALEDFFFDAKNILGTKTILKQLSNDNGNPQFTHTLDLTVIWPNGMQASRVGLKVKEWIEGFGSGNWSDNVFEVTGNWTSTFVNGNSHSYEVVIPLRREVICYYFVSGSIDVERTNFSGVFDYGMGECDNEATFTFANGEVVTITLN